MKQVNHPLCNRVLGAPKGWNANEGTKALPCDALAVRDDVINGVPVVISFWKPDAQELALLNAGGTVALHVCGYSMPPVMLATTAHNPLAD